MNPTRPTPRATALAAAAMLLPWIVGAARGAAQRPPRTVPTPQEFVTTQDDSLFSLTRSQEDVHQWEQALTDLQNGQFQSAVERLHRLLQNEAGGAAAIGPNRFVGLRHAVVLTMANLPAAAAEAYEQLVRRQAGSLHDRDPRELREEQLVALAERFPAAGIGRRARLRLGDLCLERGDGLGAAGHFAQALESAPIDSELERAVQERMRCADALVRAGALRATAASTSPEGQVLAVVPEALDRTDWPAFGGGTDGARPMREPVGRPQPHFQDQVSAVGFDGDGGTFAMQPVGDLHAIYVHTGLELQVYDPLRQDLLWTSPSPLREQTSARAIADYPGSINQNMVLAPALGDDVVVAALQVPDESSLVRYQNAFTIVHRIPERRLFAFERSSGRLLWSHFDRIEGPVTQRFSGHSSCGPPLVVGDTVYAPVHDRSGAIAFYLGAYDLHTGQPRWRRLICSSQQEVNMFGNARMEFAASPLCESEGLILGASNLGVCYGVERATGHLRWITAYDVIRMPPAQLQAQDTRTVFFQNSAPAVVDGVLCCTPLDSEWVLGLDALSGAPLWRLPHEAKARGNNDVRWLCGGIGHEFVLAGAGVVAVTARPGPGDGGRPAVRSVRGPEFLRGDDRGEQPRPALTGRRIWFPTEHGVSVFDVDGNPAPDSGDLRLLAPGNLLLVDGIAVSLGNRTLEVLLDAQALRQDAKLQLDRNPADPAAILRLCTLRTALGGDDGGDRDLEQALRAGLAACQAQGLPADNPLHATFRRRLFELAQSTADRVGTLESLLAARDLAPDVAAFLAIQGRVLPLVERDPDALRRELDLLDQRAGNERWDLPGAGGPVEVATYTAWRRIDLDADPVQQLLGWQDLLQHHGHQMLHGAVVADLATAAISRLLQQHGRELYAPLELRAQALLHEAGDNREALAAVGRAFPHSDAARAAQRRLLDAAVRDGDLATAVAVYAQAGNGAAPDAATARRLLEAARVRGNLALAAAMAERLRSAAGSSDWPADGGRPFAVAAAELAEQLAADIAAVQRRSAMAVPAEIVDQLDNGNPTFPFRPLPTDVEAGFAGAPDVPLYVTVDDRVRAIDVWARQRPTLFEFKSPFADRLWVCGSTAVIASLQELSGLDARTGAVRWRIGAQGRLLLCHGVVDGVLQLTQRESGSAVELLGIEPLTGATLWSRALATAEYAPEPRLCRHDVLVMRAGGDGGDPTVVRLDPTSGRERAAFPLTAPVCEALQVPAAVASNGLMLKQVDCHQDRLYLPIAGNLRTAHRPTVVAITADGAVAWQWEGGDGAQLLLAARCGERYAVVEQRQPDDRRRRADGGRLVLLALADGSPVRTIDLGADAQVLNWPQRGNASPPSSLLLADLDPSDTDSRRLVRVDLAGDSEPFALAVGGAGEEVLRTPRCDDDLLVFAVHSRRTQGPVRLFALRTADRRGALPDNGKYVLVPVPQQSPHEMATVGPYTVMITDSSIQVLGDGKDIR